MVDVFGGNNHDQSIVGFFYTSQGGLNSLRSSRLSTLDLIGGRRESASSRNQPGGVLFSRQSRQDATSTRAAYISSAVNHSTSHGEE